VVARSWRARRFWILDNPILVGMPEGDAVPVDAGPVKCNVL
jgi:hypothetical protein